MGLYEYMFGGGEKVEDDLEEIQKGMGYGELILDNVIGLDNDYDSFGDKLGRTINEDEIGFVKQAGQGIYEGAKDFIKAPIETTKEAVKEVATSTKDLFTKSLDERLQEMYGVDMTSATGDQITAARESVMSDALGASALIPAAGVGIKGAKVLANAMPEVEFDPNTVGMNMGNVSFKPKDSKVEYVSTQMLADTVPQFNYQRYDVGKFGGDFESGNLGENPAVLKDFENSGEPTLKESIAKDGIKEPIEIEVVLSNGEVSLGKGNHRLQAAIELGLEEVPVVIKTQQTPRTGRSGDGVVGPAIADLSGIPKDSGEYSFSEFNLLDRIIKPKESPEEIQQRGGTVFTDFETGEISDRRFPSTYTPIKDTVPATVADQTENMLDTSKVVPGGNPEFGPTGRISTRMPLQAPLKDEIPAEEFYSGELTIGRDVMDEAGTTEKNMEYLASNREQSDDVVKSKGTERPLFTSKTPNPYEDIGDVPYFPGFKALEGMSTEDRVKFVSAMQKENLEWVMDKLPQGFQDRAKLWYTGANRFSEELSSKYGVPRQSMSGVLAALSPQKDWFQNASLAERVADAAINNRNFPWSSEMSAVVNKYPTFKTGGRGKNAAIWESIQGKKYSELETTKQKAMWIRAYDEAHNPKTYRALTPEGDLGEIILAGNSPKDIAWGGFNTIEKAVDALESGGDFKILSDTMGGQHKVRNFFNNIEVPFSDMGDVTIDTHAIAAALMRPLGGDDRLVAQGLGAIGGQNKSLGAKGNYGFIADDYRDVADNRGLLPREVQSITWEGIRSLFNNKSDAVKRKVNTIWSQVDKGNLTQQQALDLIEAEMGGFGATNQVLTPRTNRSIAAGSSTMFAAGGLALLDDDIEEEGFATPQ